MFIKSIVLDGFKSYGNRVEVTGFDPEFNAITGLNGTGKSNILDSICFVLGITNLSNVRASSLQELIYKHGHAGITKATVSILFDNRDKEQCPMGYENHKEITVTRQVVLGGKNKYMINGINVQNKRVSDLFCSVQLNVNNPHFLIMQGRITKVLNMKPPEILSMVEEAAGTKMYETKKQAAQKTIEKKDAKLKELNDIIKEEIAPKLQKLQDERAQFQEYQKVVRELGNLQRLYVAWKYVNAEQNLKKAEGKVQEVKDVINEKKENIKSNENESKDLDNVIAEVNMKLDEESGSALKDLERELQLADQNEAKLSTEHKAAKETLAEHEKQCKVLEKTLRQDEKALANKQKDLDGASSIFDTLRSASESSEVALAEAQAKFLAVSSGLDGDSGTLQDQLMAANQEASDTSTRIIQSEMERKHAEQRLRTVQTEFANSSAQYQRDRNGIAEQQARLDKLQSELSALQYSPTRETELRERVRTLTSRARAQREATDRSEAQLQRCDFRYQDPAPNFDRRRVAGTVCRLIEVCDPVYCTALESAAGGKLYNVVVDTEVTSKLLLERGNLQSRRTFIPLNKIVSHVIDRRTVQLAQEIGGGPQNVQLALDLVTFEEWLRPAMEFVFGNVLVCRDLDVAERVTFHPQVRRRCVTLDGDISDYGGTLSGGALDTGESVLVKLKMLKESEEALRKTEEELAQCNAESNSLQQIAERYTSLQQRYDVMSNELKVVKTRLAATTYAQLHTQIETLKEQVAKLTQAAQMDELAHTEATAKVRELEAKVKDIKGFREREFKNAEEALKKAKEAAEKHSNSWKQREQEFETLRLEVSELESAVTAATELLRKTREATAALQAALDLAKNNHDTASESVKEIQGQIKTHKAAIAGRNSELARLLCKKEQLAKKNDELDLGIKELNYKIKEMQIEATECDKRIKSLEKENPWIATEREYFGAAGGLYDFEARQVQVAGQRLQQMQERRDKLARGLNARAHTLLGQEEEQYKDVMRKKKIVEADRTKLVQVMAELDEKKRCTLVTACEQVNKDFGSIFSMLLPGAQAALCSQQGKTVLDGLEVKVGFNNTWKESLGELSGGQRSLVALSLVLAMLLFKPAPLYILDEVDAALDLSHTQNIGQMLKKHFKHSQFIIVSLKDGMFNNANVLFRTKFVDGMSTVQRTVNSTHH